MRRMFLRACGFLLIGLTAPAQALIITPPLDSNSYSILRNELVGRIPAIAPGWTDHSESDPGATLLDLFAFTIEDLVYQALLDLSGEVPWPDFDPEDDATQGSVAYVLLDAAWLARYGNDVREQDWLMQQGINPEWTYTELRAAAVHTVPEPGPLALLAMGLVLVALRRRVRSSPCTCGAARD